MTLAKWKDRYPPKPIRRGYGKPKAERNYYPDAVLARLLVALCDQLRAGELVLRGFDLDLREERPIDPVLYDLPHMLLDPGADEFRPEAERRGSNHRRLTLWPAPGDAGRASAEAVEKSQERAAAADSVPIAYPAGARGSRGKQPSEEAPPARFIGGAVGRPPEHTQYSRAASQGTVGAQRAEGDLGSRIQSIADEDEFRKLVASRVAETGENHRLMR